MRRRFLITLATALAIALLAVSPAWAESKYKILHAFGRGRDGAGVFAGLGLDPKGNLYGVTTGGGAYGSGTVFELTPGAGAEWNEKILHSFCQGGGRCSDGSLPWDTPVLDPEGNLYDDSNAGIFEMTPGPHGWTFKLIYSGGGSESQDDLALYNAPGIDDLLLDAAGNLYGTFGVGKNYKGAIGELSLGTGGWKEEDIFDFCLHPHNFECLGGSVPEFRLAWDASGNLYGVTTEGGADDGGVVFQLEYSGSAWKEHVLHSFRDSQSDGYRPYAGPVVDQAGNVYGTTAQGGGGAGCEPTGCGSVYRLSKGKNGQWAETILYNFPDYPKNGGGPSAGLVFDQAGNLYGTATGGGDPSCSCGVVFKLAPETGGKWKYTILHRFTGKDGYSPQAGLIFDQDYKHLYGTTTEGGPGNYGVVFEITP